MMKVAFASALLCLYLAQAADAAGGIPAGALCPICPTLVRENIRSFCNVPFLPILTRNNCLKMDTKNSDAQLTTKVCEPIGICGKGIQCSDCNKVYKNVVLTLCDDLNGFIFPFFPWSGACRLAINIVVHLHPTIFDAACKHIGCTYPVPCSWGYDAKSCYGPDKWASAYPQHCGGTSQSPINLEPTKMTNKGDGTPLYTPGDLSELVTGKLSNNGHSLKFTPDAGQGSKFTFTLDKVTGTPTYKFLQFHFHWGSSNTKGSEHTVDGKSYPLEMHFVTVNTKYSTAAEALANKDGLAVFGLFFDVDSTASSYVLDTVFDTSLKTITDAADQITTTVAYTLNPSDFLTGIENAVVYTYDGSLTTPTCNEVVSWNVIANSKPVSQNTMNLLRKLKESHGEPLVDNFRPPLPLNGRIVTKWN